MFLQNCKKSQSEIHFLFNHTYIIYYNMLAGLESVFYYIKNYLICK